MSSTRARTRTTLAVLAALATASATIFVCCTPRTSAPEAAPAPDQASSAPAKAPTLAAPSAPSVAAAPPAAAPPPAPPPARRPYIIAAIGDSLTDYASHGGGYLRYVAKRCPETRIENFGKGGFMVNQMRRRFAAELVASGQRYTHLLVFGGVNDLYSDLTARRTPEKIMADLSAMYAGGRERSMRVVAVTVAPWGGFRRYYNERRGAATVRLNGWIREQLAADTVDYVVDAHALLSCGEPEHLCPRYEMRVPDGLHLGADGHERLGRALYEQVFADCR
jgi:lysophospholipase L1-like esterase